MVTDGPGGVDLVDAADLPRLAAEIARDAGDFVMVVGAVPGLPEALLAALAWRLDVRIVVTSGDAETFRRELTAYAEAGATVVVDGAPCPFVVGSDARALEGPAAFEDVPRPGTTCVHVAHRTAGARWARVVARAKLAQCGTRPIADDPGWGAWRHRLAGALFARTVPFHRGPD